MSEQSTARKLQQRYGLRYQAALQWVRNEQYRDLAGRSRREGQSFSDRLVEVIAEQHHLKEATPS